MPESTKLDQYVQDGFRVEMDDVNFSYEEDQRVISDSSFEVNRGQNVSCCSLDRRTMFIWEPLLMTKSSGLSAATGWPLLSLRLKGTTILA